MVFRLKSTNVICLPVILLHLSNDGCLIFLQRLWPCGGRRPVVAFVVTENKNRPFQKRFRAPRSAVAYRFLGWSIFIAVYPLSLWVFSDISQVFLD